MRLVPSLSPSLLSRVYLCSLTYPGSLLLRGVQLRVFLLEMRNESRRIRHGDAHRYVKGRCDDAGTDLQKMTCTASAKRISPYFSILKVASDKTSPSLPNLFI